MPPNFFQKPETALKRAHELISVGKEMDALETLHDTIKVSHFFQITLKYIKIVLEFIIHKRTQTVILFHNMLIIWIHFGVQKYELVIKNMVSVITIFSSTNIQIFSILTGKFLENKVSSDKEFREHDF